MKTFVHEIAHTYAPPQLWRGSMVENCIHMIIYPVLLYFNYEHDMLDTGYQSSADDYFKFLKNGDYIAYITKNEYSMGFLMFEQLRIAYGNFFPTLVLSLYRLKNNEEIEGLNWRQKFVLNCCHAAKKNLLPFFKHHNFTTKFSDDDKFNDYQFETILNNTGYPTCNREIINNCLDLDDGNFIEVIDY